MKAHPNLKTLLGCLLITATISSVNGKQNPRIIIVGAGAAGIAASSRLYQGGLTNIVILEASDRVGGRIFTTPFGSGLVELGAQWCHGEKDNVVFEMASVYPELLSSSVILDGHLLMRSDGKPVPEELVESLMNLATQIIDSDERNSFAGSLGEFFTERYWQHLHADDSYDVDRELAEQFLVYFHNQLRGYEAYDTWYEVAAREHDNYVESEGNPALAWNGTKGYSIILDIVSGNYPDILNETLTPVPLSKLINYGKFVSNIQWNGTTNETILVTTEDGSRYDADHVVVTVSLGVLKENHPTMFTPALPTVNQNAINGLYFGTVNKIFLFFDTPLPENLSNIVHLLWYKSDIDVLRRSNHAWAEAVSAFFRVDNQPNVLAAWINGIEGARAELLSDDTIRDGLLYLLSIFARDVNFGNVQDILRSKWSSNRHFRGSYSSRSIATEKLNTGAQNLSQPLVNASDRPLVMFAGEATNKKRYATVHGAIESGFREAKRLLDLYQ